MNERKRILIVDDDPVVTALLSRILEEHGFEPAATTDPTLAIHHAYELKPSLVILDFDMPGLEGSEVAVLLKSRPETRNLPIVFLSGKTDEEHQNAAHFSGAIKYLHKPIQPKEVMEVIQTLLDAKPSAKK